MSKRVIIVEDDEAVAKLIASVLTSSGFEVCGTAATGADGVALARREHPDVALVDLGLPNMSGEEVIETIREELPETACIALTAVDVPARALGALRAGGAGYILKPFHASELARSIEEVLSGDAAPISPRAAKVLLQELRGDPPDQRAKDSPALSKRELEVLQLLVHGHSYADVAAALGLGESEVRACVKRIYDKMTTAGGRDAPHLRGPLVFLCKVGMAASLVALVLLAMCGTR